MGNRWGQSDGVRLYFWGLQNHCRWWLQPWNQKTLTPWKKSYDQPVITPILWPPHEKSWLIGKGSDAGRDWGQEEKGTTEDEMAGWHRGLDGCESEWTPGDGAGQGGLVCCDSWGREELDTTEWLNWTELMTPSPPKASRYVQKWMFLKLEYFKCFCFILLDKIKNYNFKCLEFSTFYNPYKSKYFLVIVYSFLQQIFSSTYYVPDTHLGTWDTPVIKIENITTHMLLNI